MDEGGHACPKCRGDMEEGWVADMEHGATFQSAWVEGEPRSSWLGPLSHRKSTSGCTARWIRSYRCTQCGYLELYATEKLP